MKRGRVFERVTLGGVVVAAGLLVAQSPSGSIQGTVKSEEGMPIRCLLLVSNGMFRESVGNVVERRAFTAADGSFTVPSLPAGNYTTCAVVPRESIRPSDDPFVDSCLWDEPPASVQVASGQTTRGVAVVLQRGDLLYFRPKRSMSQATCSLTGEVVELAASGN